LVAVLLTLVIYLILKGRGFVRWLYIAMIFFILGGGIAAPWVGDNPSVINICQFVVSLLAFVTIALLLLNESTKYFAEIKGVRPAPASARTGSGSAPARPPGLRGLFAPPPPREPRTARPNAVGRKSATTRPADSNAGKIEGRVKPKVRASAETTRDGADSGDAVVDAVAGTTAGSPARPRGKSRRI
jgi:hypothetical protein